MGDAAVDTAVGYPTRRAKPQATGEPQEEGLTKALREHLTEIGTGSRPGKREVPPTRPKSRKGAVSQVSNCPDGLEGRTGTHAGWSRRGATRKRENGHEAGRAGGPERGCES